MTGLYIHFPFCIRKCAYCAFESVTDLSIINKYTELLLAELRSRKTLDIIDTVYFGGGTPSLSIEFVRSVMAAIRSSYILSKSCEISMECNPDSMKNEPGAFVDAGINRFSIGLQSASDNLLQAIGRVHTSRDFFICVEKLRRSGADNISCDIMLALPGQTVSDAMFTVDAVKPLVDHLSCYGLMPESGTAMADYKPDEDLAADMYDAVYNALIAAYFNRYEVSNFSKPGFECRHNMGYWTRKNYIGVGAAAHSLVGGERIENPLLKGYLNGDMPNRYSLSEEEVIKEKIMLSLRMEKGLNLGQFELETGKSLLKIRAKAIEKLLKLGVIEIARGNLRIKRSSFMVMNSILAELV